MHPQPQHQQNPKLKLEKQQVNVLQNLDLAAEKVARQRIDNNGTDVQNDAHAG